jgi:multicomponent Na+:H+ antiporter subunit D
MSPEPETLVLVALAAPFVGALIIPLFHRQPNLRETVTIVSASVLSAAVLGLLSPVLSGARPQAQIIEVLPGLTLAFQVEPLGMLFALVASLLWIVNSIYSIGYMRANEEPRQTGYYVCFAVALGSTMGIAFAKNLFTLFLFYEALTISTYPLVAHHQDAEAMRAGRLYLLMLLGGSLVLFLPAIVATWVLAGTVDFVPGGVLGGKASAPVVALLLGLYLFGVGKAAVMPLHFWLPAAMVAPTPVSALLHAVAVVKAGVFTIAKLAAYTFGLETLSAPGVNGWAVYLASACIVAASLIALTRGNLKARLAYSTVSQLAYVVLGAVIATPLALVGSGMHLAMHAFGKITLFFCAGAIYVAHHKTEIAQLDGIGRLMPVTMLAFLVASLSVIGLPPLGGTWSKWMLALAAADRGYLVAVGALMLSSLLNVFYLLSIVARAFFLPLPDAAASKPVKIAEAPLTCVVPLSITALVSVALFFVPDRIEALLVRVFVGG